MILPPLFEFGKLIVADASVPGRERILFRPTEPINLAQCGLLIGWRNEDGNITPLKDHFYWIFEMTVEPPCWIVVYTGKGTFNQGEHNGQPVYIHYWGMEQTVFNCREMIPLLIKFQGMQIGEHLKVLPPFEEYMKQLEPPAS
jgi:hypothetical protein